MHESSKRGGGASAHPHEVVGAGSLSERITRTGLRFGQYELSVERSLDRLSVAPLRVDGLRGIKLA
jgi:hypothetical protein